SQQDVQVEAAGAVGVPEEGVKAPTQEAVVPAARGGEIHLRGVAGRAVPIDLNRARLGSVLGTGRVEPDYAERAARPEVTYQNVRGQEDLAALSLRRPGQGGSELVPGAVPARVLLAALLQRHITPPNV